VIAIAYFWQGPLSEPFKY